MKNWKIDNSNLANSYFLNLLLEKNRSKKIVSSHAKNIIIKNITIKVSKVDLKFERFFLGKKSCEIFKKNAKKLRKKYKKNT